MPRNKMKEITAQLNSHRQSPRKVRVVANAIKGKGVSDAKARLDFIVKSASHPIHKLLNSAIANAKNLGVAAENLRVKSVEVNAGKILYRRRPVSHGSAHPIHKRTSHITIVLQERKSEAKNSNLKTKN
jgi:large subunit ribosomal protein L22